MSLNDIMNSGLIPGTGTPSSSSNTSSSGSSGAENLNSLIDAFIWQTVHSSPSTMTWYAAFAIMIEGMLLGLVLMNVWRYYMFFGRSDHWLILTSIGVGTCLSVAQMGVNCHQVRELVIHAAVDYSSIARADAWQTLAVTFVTAHFNAAATSFYSWRAWKLSGRKRIMIAPLCLGIVTSYALVWPVVIQGARFPEININNAKKLFDWLMLDAKLIRVWGCVSVAIDVCVCILLVFLFLRTKESMFHTERALMNKLLVLVFETMIPPTVVMLILVSWTSVTGSGLTDFWRVLVWALPNLYFLSILHSLISRRAIKTMIDSRQLSDGIRIVNGQPLSFGNRTRTIEEGGGTFGVLSDAGSVKVEIDTIVHESMPVLNSQSPRRPARPLAASQLPDMAEKGQLRRPSDEPPFNRLPRLDLDHPSPNPSLRTSSSDSHKSPKRKPAPPLDSYYWPEVSPEPLKHLKI